METKDIGISESIDWPFFTDDEKDSFRRELKKFEPDKVEAFISNLQVKCQLFHLTMIGPEWTDHRDDLAAMLETFKESLKCLDKLSMIKSRVMPPHLMQDFQKKNTPLKNDNAVRNLALEAYPLMAKLLSSIENQQNINLRSPGEKEPVVESFTLEVARLWIHHFQKTPKPTKDGPFERFMILALESVGIVRKSAHKSIVKALKQIPK